MIGTCFRIALALGILAAAMVMNVERASAQGFQWTYGSNNCSQIGLYGTTQLAGGGYVAVGCWSFGFFCAGRDAYVIRTNANGGLNWAITIDLGGNDSITDVVECANGDLVACGVVANTANCGGATRDIFVVRLNSVTGAVINVNTIGSPFDDIAWDVEEAVTGGGSNSVVGDILVAGWTTQFGGAAPTDRDGVILRLTAALAYRWGCQYGGGAPDADDQFYSLAEATVGVPAGTPGDIVAVGATRTWGVGGIDVFAVRVNGNSGAIGAAPQGGATFGLTFNEAAYRVRELRTSGAGFYPGDFILCGSTNSRPPAGTNSEAILIQMQPTLCNPQRGDCWFGDAVSGIDVAQDVQEVRSTAGGLPQGSVVVAGITVLSPTATSAGENMFMKEFNVGPAGLLLPNAGEVYGGLNRDWGYSIGVCTRNTLTENPGYVICGYTESTNLLAAGDPRGLYLVKTRVNRLSSCNENALTVTPAAADFVPGCPTVAVGIFGKQCPPTITPVPNESSRQNCYVFPAAREKGDGGNDGGGAYVSGVAGPATNTSAVTIYPNPIRSGVPLTLTGFTIGGSPVTITVTDMTGREVYAHTLIPLSNEITVPTEALVSGSYMLEIAAGTTRGVHRVVIVE